MSARAFRWLATAWVVVAFVAAGLFARGGGGCLAAGTRVATPHGEVAIEELRAGDAVWSVVDGQRTAAQVAAVFAVEPAEFFEFTAADGRVLLATPEHPLALGLDSFQRADAVSASTALFAAEPAAGVDAENSAAPPPRESAPSATAGTVAVPNSVACGATLDADASLSPHTLASVRRVAADGRRAYNLLVAPGGVFFANGFLVHNKGCFLPDTPVLLADGSRRAIRDVRAGDTVLAFDSSNHAVPARVVAIYTHEVKSFLVVRTARVELRVTEEHPFYVGDGTFKTIGALHVGDTIWAHDGAGGLAPQQLLSVERVAQPATVYNLQTEEPHTYFADGIAVHNKGGGGCFAAGTLVATPTGDRAIETLQPGDTVLARDDRGALVPVAVQGVYLNFAPLRVLHTTRGTLRTTDEHPLLDAAPGENAGEFRRAEAFAVGGTLGSLAGPATILRIEAGGPAVAVYTLSVGAPHTFVADGFVVHNKGGSSSRSSSRSSSSRRSGSSSSSGGGGAPGSFVVFLVIAFGVIVVVIILKNAKQGAGLELDHCFSRAQIDAKADKTEKLVEFISRVDASWTANALVAGARETFLELQRCWRARDYTDMKARMMPDLFAQHCAQLEGMRRTHEINVLDQLQVDAVDLVHVHYTDKPEGRSFTVLITAQARDTYIDDRTNQFLRGDDAVARFQEFWTFHFHEKRWCLREIEQTQESAALTTENFFEQFTDEGRNQVYGDTAGATGPAGPTLPAAVQEKDDKIERLLNFLVVTDKIWNRETMLATARRVYLQTLLAWQDGRPEAFGGMELSAESAAELRAINESNRRNGWSVEYRNLCIRKVEIVHVDNRDDRALDNFTARISAHAQRRVLRGGAEVRGDPDVRAWVEFATFRRDQARWVLHELLPDTAGHDALARENVDQGTGEQMLQWYYSKSRAT